MADADTTAAISRLRAEVDDPDLSQTGHGRQHLADLALLLVEHDARTERDAADQAEIDRLRVWVDDLQSGMWINCAYCGHRYGPWDRTPTSGAKLLTAHIEVCPEHPLSHALALIGRLVPAAQRLLAASNAGWAAIGRVMVEANRAGTVPGSIRYVFAQESPAFVECQAAAEALESLLARSTPLSTLDCGVHSKGG